MACIKLKYIKIIIINVIKMFTEKIDQNEGPKSNLNTLRKKNERKNSTNLQNSQFKE